MFERFVYTIAAAFTLNFILGINKRKTLVYESFYLLKYKEV